MSEVRGLGVSTFGNTAGQTGTQTGTVVLAGLDAVTLSQATAPGIETISISVPVQSVQPAIGGIGVSTIGNTAGQTGTHTGTLVLVGLGDVTLSQATAVGGETISISMASDRQASFFDNCANPRELSVIIGNTPLNINTASLTFAPVSPEYAFPFDMSPQMLVLDMNNTIAEDFGDQLIRPATYTSVPVSVTVTLVVGETFLVGLYTISGSSVLTLINSGRASATDSLSNSTTVPTSTSSINLIGFTTIFSSGSIGGGNRWAIFNNTDWSSSLSFQQGVEYLMAVIVLASRTVLKTWNSDLSSVTLGGGIARNNNFTLFGQAQGLSQSSSRRGILGNASASAATLGGMQFAGIYSNVTVLPTSVHISQITKTGINNAAVIAQTLMMPRVILNNYGSGVL